MEGFYADKDCEQGMMWDVGQLQTDLRVWIIGCGVLTSGRTRIWSVQDVITNVIASRHCFAVPRTDI